MLQWKQAFNLDAEQINAAVRNFLSHKKNEKSKKARVIKDLHYSWYLRILSALHEPSGEYNLKAFSDITSSVNP